MIKAVFASLAILLGVGLSAGDKADASGCGRAEVQAVCAGHNLIAVPLRRGQIRRAERRARREHRRAVCEAPVAATCSAAAVYAPATTCAAPRVRCGGVAVVTPAVVVEVPACCD